VIEVRDLVKVYDTRGQVVRAVDNVSTTVAKGEVLVVIGPSGSGKSTFLRCLNGLEEFDSGSVSIDGLQLADPKTDVNAYRREVGMVFQHFNLFPHMTVLENLCLAQKVVRKRGKKEREAKAMVLLEKVGIAKKAKAFPSRMYGGHPKRVAVCPAPGLGTGGVSLATARPSLRAGVKASLPATSCPACTSTGRALGSSGLADCTLPSAPTCARSSTVCGGGAWSEAGSAAAAGVAANKQAASASPDAIRVERKSSVIAVSEKVTGGTRSDG